MNKEAQEAYSRWKKQHTVDMQVRTDEQMFMIGFEQCQGVVKELTELVLELEKENKRLDAMVKKLQKELKNVKKV